MIRKLPYADWMAAQAELERINEQVVKIDLPHLAPMLEQIRKSLVVEASPTLAGAELEFVADQLRSYPELRELVSGLMLSLAIYVPIVLFRWITVIVFKAQGMTLGIACLESVLLLAAVFLFFSQKSALN